MKSAYMGERQNNYGGGGGGNRRRGGYRDEYDRHDRDRRPEPMDSPEQKLKNAIIRLGEVDPTEELPHVVSQIQKVRPSPIPGISEAFRTGVTEQPFKIPYYAALLRLLHNKSEEDGDSDETPSLGRQILEDIWKNFQAYLDNLSWRETRLCIQFFAHLTCAGVVSADSMFALLQSFTTVMEEFGVSHGRAKSAAMCAAEGLMIAGPVLKPISADDVKAIITTIQTYNDTMSPAKWIVQPIVQLHSSSAVVENADEVLDILLSTLTVLDASDFVETSTSFVQPYSAYTDMTAIASQFSLPSVLVPPEVIELDGLSTDAGEDTQVKKEVWPDYSLRLFDNDITPDPTTPAGYAVRTALCDLVDIFEVNRKECARLLLEFPKWSVPGTFRPPPRPVGESQDELPPGPNWQLESTLVETILGAYLALPESSHRSIYYIGLITELCKLAPPTAGPAVGKSIRKLYNSLADGLDVEVARRFAEWFAIHMSNFGFQWVWKEWLGDLVLSVQHPRRAFMRRALEFEIRLSYHDRILKTIPDAMQEPDAHTIAEQAPGPDYDYEDPKNPYYQAAQAVLNLFRGRAKAEDVISHLDGLKSSLESSEIDVGSVGTTVRFIAVQSLLHIGSRSFSHLLNAIERYLPLLRMLASGGMSTTTAGGSGNPEAKSDILTAAAAFWKLNRQMVNIVFDKLMQYQIVDPTDVVSWTFINGASIGQRSGKTEPLRLSAFEWDLLKGALDKANGRVMIARRKVTGLRKEDEDTRARAKASGGGEAVDSMEIDTDPKPEEEQAAVPENPALTTALKAFASLTREQKAALSGTLQGFVSALAPGASDSNPNPLARTVVTENSWHNRANWGDEEWNAWETWGWYRQFCRAYSPYLRTYSTTLWAVSLTKLEGVNDPAAELLIKVWNIATGQDA